MDVLEVYKGETLINEVDATILADWSTEPINPERYYIVAKGEHQTSDSLEAYYGCPAWARQSGYPTRREAEADAGLVGK